MINELCILLYNKIVSSGLPFLEVVAGLARVQSDVIPKSEDEAGNNTQRYPVATTHNLGSCHGKELNLIPDGQYKSIIYFEGGRSNFNPWLGRDGYSTSVRLIFWCNRALLVSDVYSEITSVIQQQLISLLAPKTFENIAGFLRLKGEVSQIVQDASIFGRYTYTETDKQYLRPPYDFFAIDFTFRYNVGEGCMVPITYGAATCI